jgi:hypothetical protein
LLKVFCSLTISCSCCEYDKRNILSVWVIVVDKLNVIKITIDAETKKGFTVYN